LPRVGIFFEENFTDILHRIKSTMIGTTTTTANKSTQASFHHRSRILPQRISRIPSLLAFLVFFSVSKPVNSFTTNNHVGRTFDNMVQEQQSSLYQSDRQIQEENHESVCELPGDPSLILTTNVDLGSMKMDIMKSKKTF
jgi:hypothetical protein